jgi:hypothetical protein
MPPVPYRSRSFATALSRWMRPLSPADPIAPYGYDYSSHDLRIDEDVVCPRCLEWIAPDEIVRRTVYGPAQHEACPRPRL